MKLELRHPWFVFDVGKKRLRYSATVIYPDGETEVYEDKYNCWIKLPGQNKLNISMDRLLSHLLSNKKNKSGLELK